MTDWLTLSSELTKCHTNTIWLGFTRVLVSGTKEDNKQWENIGPMKKLSIRPSRFKIRASLNISFPSQKLLDEGKLKQLRCAYDLSGILQTIQRHLKLSGGVLQNISENPSSTCGMTSGTKALFGYTCISFRLDFRCQNQQIKSQPSDLCADSLGAAHTESTPLINVASVFVILKRAMLFLIKGWGGFQGCFVCWPLDSCSGIAWLKSKWQPTPDVFVARFGWSVRLLSNVLSQALHPVNVITGAVMGP